MLRLTSPLASRFTAASLGLLDEVLFNVEKRRSGDLEGENGERKGVIYSADFIKCAGEGKPDFIKYGSEPMGSVPSGAGCFRWDLRRFGEIAGNENCLRKSLRRGFAGDEVCSRRVWDGEVRA